MEFDDVFDDLDAESTTDPRISSGTRSPIGTPLTPSYETDFPDDINEDKDINVGFIPPTFTISYMHTVLPAVENFLSLDDRLRLEDLKDEVLTVHEMKKHLDNYYLALLRLSVDCPYKEVRKGSRGILQRAVVSFGLFDEKDLIVLRCYTDIFGRYRTAGFKYQSLSMPDLHGLYQSTRRLV